MRHVLLIAGMPGAGKTTQAEFFAKRYDALIFSKDSFKEILFDEIGFKTADEKEQLDIASIKLMLKAAELSLSGNKNVIIESNFMTRDKKYLKEFEEKTGETITTLRMDCDMDVLYDRALARDGSSSRHPAHSVADHYPAPEGEELVYSPLWTKEEYKYNVKISGVQDFSYGTTFTIDTTDFIKIRLDEVAMELDKLFLE
ncbi:MAG: AAA family ATPase [Oscillospiraceae bacterium]|nr:AAA family ATPase [Oscillospiraceae bacterium]MBR0452219.1 AAA family ATPase [Oscillospiraceae bacterium]